MLRTSPDATLTSRPINDSATLAAVALIYGVTIAIITLAGFPSLALLPAASVGVYGLTLLFLPKYRPLRAMPLCPINLAHVIILLKFVIMPLSIVALGLEIAELPAEPSISSMLKALLLSCLLLVSFAAGFSLHRAVNTSHAYNSRTTQGHQWERKSKGGLAFGVSCILIGLIGMYFAFPDLYSLWEYYLRPPQQSGLAISAVSATPQQVISGLLRPFLPFGLILLWGAYVSRPSIKRSIPLRTAATVVTAALIAIVLLTYSYNRGSFVFPIVALAASYSRHVAHVRAKALLVLALLLWLPMTLIAAYRSSTYALTQLLGEDNVRSDLTGRVNSTAALQVYAAGPQFEAYFLDSFNWSPPLTYGKAIVSSLLYPVPVLGKPFREDSGVIAYNRVLRGPNNLDAVVPFEVELFCDFHILGVMCGGLLFGAAIKRFQNAFVKSRDKTDTYSCQYMSMWLLYLFVGGVSVVSQIFIVFMWPIYVYKVVCMCKRDSSPMPAVPTHRGQVWRTDRWRIIERTGLR